MTVASKPWPVTTACCPRKTKKEKDGIAVLFLLLFFLFMVVNHLGKMINYKLLCRSMVKHNGMTMWMLGLCQKF